MDQDQQHLRLLSIFHYICAGMSAFFACFPIFYLGLGLYMVLRPESFGQGGHPPPPILGWVLVVISSTIMLFGWTFAALLAFAGRSLTRRKRYMFCLVIACLECLFMPFGTVLGVFSILVLMRPSVKQLFDANAIPAVSK